VILSLYVLAYAAAFGRAHVVYVNWRLTRRAAMRMFLILAAALRDPQQGRRALALPGSFSSDVFG